MLLPDKTLYDEWLEIQSKNYVIDARQESYWQDSFVEAYLGEFDDFDDVVVAWGERRGLSAEVRRARVFDTPEWLDYSEAAVYGVRVVGLSQGRYAAFDDGEPFYSTEVSN